MRINFVKYVSNIESRNFHDDIDEAIDNIIFTKSFDWRYEKEFRVLISRNGLIPFDLNSISSIIFGTKCLKGDIEKTIALIKKSNLSINYHRCELAKEKFKLEIKPLF